MNNHNTNNSNNAEIRNHMITSFRRQRGFRHLANYLKKRANTNCSSSSSAFPSLDLIKEVLSALETVAMFPLGSGSGGDEDTIVVPTGSNNNSTTSNQQGQQHKHLQAQKINAIHDECRAIASA